MFSFFNELDLLKLRCEELKELNPVHILVESPYTHTGDPKPLYYEQNKHLFKDYNIIHLIDQSMPNDGDAWHNENHQRDTGVFGLFDMEDDDVIGIFDADEIPKSEMVKQYKPEMGITGVKMDKFSYTLNCLEGYQQWEMGKLVTYEILKQTTPNKIRNGGHKTIMCNAGWHFSFLGGVEKMKEKLFAYAHTETVTSDLLSRLERKFESGQSLWGNDYWRFIDIDETFPRYLREHQEEFKHLIKQS